MKNGIDEYVKLRENESNKDREFVELFKRNYDEIVKFISLDPKQRIAIVLLVLKVWIYLNNMVNQKERTYN